jgi:hypothetical protein
MKNDHTRRNFLIASGTGAAAIGVVAAMPSIASASPPSSPEPSAPTAADAGPLVAHISDPSSGTLSLLVGDQEVIVHDHDLVGRITRAAKGK